MLTSLMLFACQKNDNHNSEKPKSSDEGGADEGEVKKTACGGFGGLLCPAGQSCIDDPSDSCDPMKGGADCMGMCIEDEVDTDKQCDFAADPNKTYVGQSNETCATLRFVCEEGKEYFADECGCGCMGQPGTQPVTQPETQPETQ